MIVEYVFIVWEMIALNGMQKRLDVFLLSLVELLVRVCQFLI